MLAKIRRIIGPLKKQSYDAGINKFFKAVKGGNLPTIVKFIRKDNELKYKFNVATVTDLNGNGYTVLHQACILGWIKVVHYFTRTYRRTIRINQWNTKDGKSPLHHASERGHKNITPYLIEDCDAHIDMLDYENRCTPFLLACKRARIIVVRYFVNECKFKKKVNLAAVDKNGWNALYYATMSCNLDTVVYITRNCALYAPINSRTPNEGYTALHTTVVCNIDYARTTKEIKNMKKRNRNTISILHYLIHHCSMDILSQDNSGSTVLHHVCADTENGALVQYMIERCFLVEDDPEDVKEFEAESTKVLRPYQRQRKKHEQNTKPYAAIDNKSDRDYFNAVHGNAIVMKLIDMKNNNGETAIDVAKGYGHDIIAHYIYMQRKMLQMELDEQEEKERKRRGGIHSDDDDDNEEDDNTIENEENKLIDDYDVNDDGDDEETDNNN